MFCLIRSHGACHILQADGLESHALEFLAHFHILFYGVHRTLGVADTAGGDGILGGILHGCIQRSFAVAEVVECVKDTDDVDAVLDGKLDELFHNVIMIVLISQQILSTQQHLQLVVGQVFPEFPQTFPRIFVQIPQTGVKGRTAPALNGIVPCLVHGRQNIGVVCIRQTGRHKRLVCITQNGFCELYFSHIEPPRLSTVFVSAAFPAYHTAPHTIPRVSALTFLVYHKVISFSIIFPKLFSFFCVNAFLLMGKRYKSHLFSLAFFAGQHSEKRKPHTRLVCAVSGKTKHLHRRFCQCRCLYRRMFQSSFASVQKRNVL